MCGITGITNNKLGALDTLVREMTSVITHRGPDDDGFFVDEKVGLGMRRLAIIDLVKGSQPIASADGRLMIFFNGEIYNYKELRVELEKSGHIFQTASDTEVVLRMFEVGGVASFKRLRGMFSFAIYDKVAQRLVLARDPFGIKPLYYWQTDETISAFSSEIKAFLEIPEFKAEVNDSAVYNYLSFQYNPLPETFFKSVYKLPPAHYLTLDLQTGQWEMKRYCEFKFNQDESLGEAETANKILQTMEDSVAHHMIADVPVGSFLSGGIDSSIIATLMQKIRGDRKIKTFTVGFESLSEGVEAKETSEPLGTDHTEITVSSEEYFEALPKALWHFDEPVADPSALGLYFLAREARKHVKVVLSGEGADELFGGYNIYLAPLARARMMWLPKGVINFFLKLPFEFFGKNYLRRVDMKLEDWYFGQKYFNESIFQRDEIQNLWKGQSEKFVSLQSLYQNLSGLSDSTKMQSIDINTWLIGDILAKADKMTMAHSLELRVPFLDMEVSKLASTLPDKFKFKGGVTKYLLREAFKNVLPESTRNRRKLGFPTPVKDWFTKERTDLYQTILENEYVKSRLDTKIIEQLIQEHVAKRQDHSRKIYLLLVLAIWYNVFIENSKLKIEN
jgi:asparagine synthase (glutamine-hydrolysing)